MINYQGLKGEVTPMGESLYPNWITEQMIEGANEVHLDSYMMALEGWRRGLSLTWYYDPKEVTDMSMKGCSPLGKIFSLSSSKRTHYFYQSRGSKITNEAVEIAQDKHLLKDYLNKANILTPKGIKVKSSKNDKEIIKLIDDISYPLTVKPLSGHAGEDVLMDIKSETELLEGIATIRENNDYAEIVIEQYIRGEEYRVYVVGEEVVAATNRIPAHVSGDGVHTIAELINEKNAERKNNPYLSRNQIEIDELLHQSLKKQHLFLESIPNNRQKIFLKGYSNISAGGDPIDVTDDIQNEIKQTAIQAVKALPGLIHSGVDIIVNEEGMFVIGVKPTADISMHIFPLEGNPRNVPAHIMDAYYPRTKGLAEDRTQIYFDLKDLNEILRNKLAQEITLTDAPNGALYTARYIVSGKVQKVGYRVWIRRQAIRKGLHGYTRNLKNGKVVVVVGGHDKEEIEKFKVTCSKGPAKAKVKRVKELGWNSPLKLGFEIRKSE